MEQTTWRNGVNKELGAVAQAMELLREEVRDFRADTEARFQRLEEKIAKNSAFISLSRGKAIAYGSILSVLGGLAGAILAAVVQLIR